MPPGRSSLPSEVVVTNMPACPQEVAATSEPSKIGKKVLLAVLLLGLCSVPFVFLLHPADAGLSLHVVKIQRVLDSFIVTFAISDETHRASDPIPLRLERLEGHAWKGVSQGVAGFSQNAKPPTLICTVHKVPGRLRVVALHQVGTSGLSTFVERLRLRLHGDKRFSLKPFDTTLFLRWDPVEAISEEFEEP
jgi:hypothetical protein